MKLAHTLPALASAAVLALCAACSPTVNTVESANPRARITPEQMKHITSDSSLDAVAQPIFLTTGKAEDGETMKVQLTIKNKKRGSARVNYRVEWKDAQGLALSGYTPVMQPVKLRGAEEKDLIAIAPSPRAADFRFVFINCDSD